MTIKYEPSAAGLSWLALSQALNSRAQMEQNVFSLYASNTDMMLTETKCQADNAQIELTNQAKSQSLGGWLAMGGSTAGLAMTGLSCGMEVFNQNKAVAAGNITSSKMDLTETDEVAQPANPNGNDGAAVNAQNGPLQVDDGAEVQGQANSAELEEEEETENSKKKKADKQTPEQKQVLRNADWWSQNSNTFSSIANQFLGQGVAGVAQAPYTTNQADAKRVETTAQGLSAVFNSQGGLMTTVLQSCDSYMQGTNGTISTITQVSAIRA